MFYKAVIVKEEKNARTITLNAKSKEAVEEMIPRIKSFLYPDEDASEYKHWICIHEVEAYGPGVKVPEYQVTVFKPQEQTIKDGFEELDDDLSIEYGCWYEEIIEEDTIEEARKTLLSKECPYKDVGYDECHVYINEVPVSMLLEEAKKSLLGRVENAYIDAKLPEMTVREYHQIHKDMEQSERMQYEAIEYMRSVFVTAQCLGRENIDLEKMSAKEYIEFVTHLPLLKDDREAWNRSFDEVKRKYGKEIGHD